MSGVESSWRHYRRTTGQPHKPVPEVVETKLPPVRIQLVLEVLSKLPASVVLSFYKQLCLIRDDKTVTISESGAPQLWSILEQLGTLPNYSATEATGGRAKRQKSGLVELPNENFGWSKVHVVQIVASIDADPGLSAKIKEARLNKKKQKGGGRLAVADVEGGSVAEGVSEGASDDIVLAGSDQADEVVIFESSHSALEAASDDVAPGLGDIDASVAEAVGREAEQPLYDQEKLDRWRRSLSVLINYWNVFRWMLNGPLAFLLQDDLLERFVKVAAESKVMRVEVDESGQEFLLIWIDTSAYWEGGRPPKKLPAVDKEAGITIVVDAFISSLKQAAEPVAEGKQPTAVN